MHLTMVILGSLLAGQPADVPEAGHAPAAAEPTRRPATPPELVADAIELPPGSKLTGRPITLLTAISSTAGRRRQLEVTLAYWRLVEAVAGYHFVLDYQSRLSQLPGRANQLPAARASAAAMLAEAEVAALAAQHELAAMVLLSPDAPMPLPADPPHVGPYRTHLDELFAAGSPPGRTRLIDRTLPIRRLAIESRAAAVIAARAEEAAAVEAFRHRRVGAAAVLLAARGSLRQREALIGSVCRYNGEIAEFVFAVAGPDADQSALLRMLIRPAAHPLRPPAAGVVQPAGHNEPVPTPAKRPDKSVPTPAKRPDKSVPTPAKRPGKNVPTPAKPPQ